MNSPELDQTVEARLQNKLPAVLEKAEEFLQNGEPYVFLTEVTSSIRSFQTGIAIKVQKGRQECSDFHLSQSSYGQEVAVSIDKLDAKSLEKDFKRFPVGEVFDKAILSPSDDIRVDMMRNIFSLSGPRGVVTFHYNYDRVMIDAVRHEDQEFSFLMEDKSDIERALAIAEVLKVIDAEVDRKLQLTTTSPTP